MPPRPTQPKSNFFGTWHREFLLPLQGQVIVQFHNLIPGTEWNPVDGARALQPFTLTPEGVRPRWSFRQENFFVLYNQRLDVLRLVASHQPDNSQLFLLELHLGLFTAGYNLRLAGDGLFAFGGTVTISWQGLPL